MYKLLKTEIKDLDEKGVVTVAANALGNIDADKDISMEGSFQKTIKENFSRLRWFLNHKTDLLLGVPLEAKENYPYLQVTGKLNLEKQIGRDTYSDYKLYAENNRTLEHSIGVEAVKKEKKDDVRRVFEWKWWEYSTLTAWGANENTPMLGIKSMEDIASQIEWLELKLKKGNYSDQRFLEIEGHLNKLRSLCTEPDSSTQMTKPNEDVLNNIFKKLNVSDDGTERFIGKIGEVCGRIR